jgi:tetratricopeptide (TPR) repeat protein
MSALTLDVNAIFHDAQCALNEETDYTVLMSHAHLMSEVMKIYDTADNALLYGYLIRKAAEWERASTVFIDAYSKHPDCLQLLYDAALSALDADEYARAEPIFRQLAELFPSLSDRHLQGIWRGASIIGMLDLALAAFNQRQDKDFANPNLINRFEQAKANQEIIRVSGIRVVSLGDNCLPWMLGNRWGLRDQAYSEAHDSVFNLAQCAVGTPAKILRDQGASLLEFGEFGLGKMPIGSPLPIHLSSGLQFNHQQGSDWMCNDFQRLRTRYKPKVQGLQSILRSGNVVFLHYAERDGADLDELVDVVSTAAGGANYHLLIIDPNPEFRQVRGHAKLTYIHHPLPHDQYVWFRPDDHDSDLGMKYEKVIADATMNLVSRLS